MGNDVDEKPNMVESCLNVESLVSSNDLKDKLSEGGENVEVEVRMGEVVAEGNSEGGIIEKDVTSNCAIEELGNGDLRQDEGRTGDRDITEERDSEQEDTNKSNKENIEDSRKSRKVSSKSSGSKKKSKNQRKEERMKIHSETHRLMREREIYIPYHIPKQRTLREFLSRKKNWAHIPLNTPPSKMLEIWKDIEENTKKAFEFFKSDSESDVESCNNNESHGKNKKKTQGNYDKSKNLHNFGDSNSNGLRNERANEVLKSNLTSESVEFVNINKESAVKKNDDNALFICENSVIEPNDLVNENDKCLTSGQEVECKKKDGNGGLINNEASSNLLVGSNQVQKESAEINDNTEEQDEKIARERTSEWVKNIPVYEMMLKPKKKELLLQKLDPKLLTITPKLSGEPDSIIDLENDKNSIEIGAKILKKRFLQNCLASRNKPKSGVELTITTSEKNGNGEISNVTTEKLIYNSAEVLRDPDLDRPGAKLQRLREELKKKIEAKWEEEYRKKMKEMAEEKNKKVVEEDVEDEEELIDDDEMEESTSEESESEEDDVVVTDKKKKTNRFIDSEAEESDCEEEESGNEGGDELDDDDEGREDSGEDSCDDPQEQPSLDKDEFPGNAYTDSQSSLIPPYQPGGGMLHGGSELTQTDGDISLPKNVLSPALRLSLDFPPSTKNDCSQQPWDIDLESPEESNTKSNFVPCFPENKNFDLNDAYEFCSGKFPGEGSDSRDVRYDEINSQDFVGTMDNDSQPNSNGFDSLSLKKNDIIEECDEDEERQKKKRSRLTVLSDDSDEETEKLLDDANELEDITEKGRVSLEGSDAASENSIPVKNRGTRKNLVFSDEEDDSETERKVTNDSDESEEENSSQNGEEDPVADEVGREVVYDSEENEIVNPGEFFDKEAELSGSEWSGDEDERGLDEFEAEDGDDEKLDENKIRSQLEKIHMRTLLDDDERKVKLLQELLFEDGDLFDDGPKREKNFRWKDLGTFFDNDDENDGSDGGNNQDQDDMEEDEQSRQSRHEKELFLLQMKSKREEMGVDDDESDISFLKRGRVVIESSSLTAMATKKVSRTVRTEADEFGFKTPFALTNKRGSFLSRNEEFLSRLAKFTSNATDNILGPKHSKNFVFAAKSPGKECSSRKENSHSKRKNVSPKGDHANNKKAKLDKPVSRVKTSILDRLT